MPKQQKYRTNEFSGTQKKGLEREGIPSSQHSGQMVSELGSTLAMAFAIPSLPHFLNRNGLTAVGLVQLQRPGTQKGLQKGLVFDYGSVVFIPESILV